MDPLQTWWFGNSGKGEESEPPPLTVHVLLDATPENPHQRAIVYENGLPDYIQDVIDYPKSSGWTRPGLVSMFKEAMKRLLQEAFSPNGEDAPFMLVESGNDGEALPDTAFLRIPGQEQQYHLDAFPCPPKRDKSLQPFVIILYLNESVVENLMNRIKQPFQRFAPIETTHFKSIAASDEGKCFYSSNTDHVDAAKYVLFPPESNVMSIHNGCYTCHRGPGRTHTATLAAAFKPTKPNRPHAVHAVDRINAYIESLSDVVIIQD